MIIELQMMCHEISDIESSVSLAKMVENLWSSLTMAFIKCVLCQLKIYLLCSLTVNSISSVEFRVYGPPPFLFSMLLAPDQMQLTTSAIVVPKGEDNVFD